MIYYILQVVCCLLDVVRYGWLLFTVERASPGRGCSIAFVGWWFWYLENAIAGFKSSGVRRSVVLAEVLTMNVTWLAAWSLEDHHGKKVGSKDCFVLLTPEPDLPVGSPTWVWEDLADCHSEFDCAPTHIYLSSFRLSIHHPSYRTDGLQDEGAVSCVGPTLWRPEEEPPSLTSQRSDLEVLRRFASLAKAVQDVLCFDPARDCSLSCAFARKPCIVEHR